MKTKAFAGETIWIIGASSGIGLALAERMSAQGATLILSARNQDALNTLNARLGGIHQVVAFDTGEAGAAKAALAEITARHPRIDRILFLAALYDPMKLDALDMKKTVAILQVNLLGAFALVDAVYPWLKAQGAGQLALCGSVAGYLGLPNGQPYSATKAGLMNLAESLRAESPAGIDIRLISPGFVRTALTAKNDFPMPMIIEPEAAADAICHGLLGSAFEIHFPRRFTYILKLLRLLPYAMLNPILKKL